MVRRITLWLGIVLLAVAGVVTAGWGAGPAPHPTPGATVPPDSSPQSLSPAQAHDVVRRSVLELDDLPRGFRRIAPDDRLADPSRELCGVHLDVGARSLAVRRVAFVSPVARSRVQNVVIVYHPGRVEHVLAEISAAAARCTHPVRPGPAQQPDVLALRVRTAGKQGVLRRDLVVERRADVLSLIEVDGRPVLPTLALARGLGDRLQRHA